jgi:hypothetical protein
LPWLEAPMWRPVAIIFAAPILVAPTMAIGAGGNVRLPPPHPITAGVPSQQVSPSELLGGCGRGRYRDPETHRCRGPADIR